MLAGRRVLIVEDEVLIALELAEIVTSAGGAPLGPVRGNREALGLLARERPDVALLDLNVCDGEVTPTAERLVAEGVPILVCTGGVLPRAMRQRWPDLPVERKPVDARRLVAALAALDAGGAAAAIPR